MPLPKKREKEKKPSQIEVKKYKKKIQNKNTKYVRKQVAHFSLDFAIQDFLGRLKNKMPKCLQNNLIKLIYPICFLGNTFNISQNTFNISNIRFETTLQALPLFQIRHNK